MFSATLLSPPIVWLAIWFIALAVGEFLCRRLRSHMCTWITPLRRLLIPYAALISGALSPRLMGLAMIDWKLSLSLGIGLVAGFSVLFLLVRMSLTTSSPTTESPTTEPKSTGAGGIWRSLAQSGAEEFSWAFLRAATWEAMLLMSVPLALPAYWATWIAAALALPDLLLHTRSTPARMIRVATLAATGVTFIYTRNFWLCWVLHAVITLTFTGVTFGQTAPQDSDRLNVDA